MNTICTITLLIILQMVSLKAQASLGLDALWLNAEFVSEGTVKAKNSNSLSLPNLPIGDMFTIRTVVTMEITDALKGSPVFFQIDESGLQSDTFHHSRPTYLNFLHVRHRTPPHHMDSRAPNFTYNKDYSVELGDKVIVFLKGIVDSSSLAHIQIPKDWIVYGVADSFLGVLTANDHVTEYFKKKN
jgi:hypothetical protein